MAHHDLLLHSDAYSDTAENRTPIDALIRTGLRRAFPLPAKGQDNDATFSLLLAALAQRHGRNKQPATSFASNSFWAGEG